MDFIITSLLAFVFLFTLVRAIEIIVRKTEQYWIIRILISSVALAGLLAFSIWTYGNY